MTNSDRLQEIRERAEKATPGPWEPTDEEFSDCRKADQYFIAEARSDIPWLLQLVTKQQREIEEMTAARDTAVGHLQDALQDIADIRATQAKGYRKQERPI